MLEAFNSILIRNFSTSFKQRPYSEHSFPTCESCPHLRWWWFCSMLGPNIISGGAKLVDQVLHPLRWCWVQVCHGSEMMLGSTACWGPQLSCKAHNPGSVPRALPWICVPLHCIKPLQISSAARALSNSTKRCAPMKRRGKKKRKEIGKRKEGK